MGGVMSSAYAIKVCVRAEIEFFKSLGTDQKYFGAIRYVDDSDGAIAYQGDSINSYIRARSLLTQFREKCYPKELRMKSEHITSSGTFKFLETETTIHGNSISVRHFSKNAMNIQQTGEQKFFSLQSFDSFSSQNSKRGVLISKLITIDSNSTSDADLVSAVADLVVEIQSTLGYTRRIFYQACQTMYIRTERQIWLSFPRMFS